MEGGVRVVASVTVELPSDPRSVRLHVFVNPPPGVRSLSFRDPGFAGTFQMFGGHGHGAAQHQPETITFTIGLTDAIKRLEGTPRLKPDAPLDIQVVAAPTGAPLNAPELKVINVTVKTF